VTVKATFDPSLLAVTFETVLISKRSVTRIGSFPFCAKEVRLSPMADSQTRISFFMVQVNLRNGEVSENHRTFVMKWDYYLAVWSVIINIA
jgi:hypothetical protein